MIIIDGEISALLPAVYSFLIIGSGYVVLWIKFKYVNSKTYARYRVRQDFYKMNPYDKAVQSLIAGIIVITITSFLSQTPYQTLSNLENLLNSNSLVLFLFFEFFVIFYLGFLWSFMELIMIKRQSKQKKRRK